jgi:hypothetical protein
MRRSPQIILVLALAALPTGCGGNDDDPVRAGTATTATVTAPSGQPTTTSTVGQGAAQTERDRIADCLKKEGFRLQGGAPQGTDASPEYQIIFSDPRGGGYIGFYRNDSRAKRVATQLRKNAQHTSGAAVERRGAINIVWVDLPDPAARAGVRDCLVT